MIKRRTARSWNDLNDILFNETWDSGIGRHRSTFAYRGASDYTWKMENSLTRLGGGQGYDALENNLIKQFKKYSYGHALENKSIWHMLSLAQHFGLPTRLLDWSYSPYVGLHFATEDISKLEQEGVVWKINFAQAHTLIPEEQKDKLKTDGSKIFSADTLADNNWDIEKLEGWAREKYPVAIFFEPPSLDQRIVAQFAYFSVISDPYMHFDDWLNHKDVKKTVDAVKIKIPKKLKLEIRDKLDQLNINERVLFPGLEGLSIWLKRHYAPIR